MSDNVSFKNRIGTKIVATFLATMFLAIGSISFSMYKQSYDIFVSSLGNKSLKIAKTGANEIDIEEFKKLNAPEDEKTESYNTMREKLNTIREMSGAKFLFTMKKDSSGNYIYIVDGLDYSSEDISHLGDSAENIYGKFDLAYSGSPYIADKIEVSEWGKLVSSLYPLKDSSGSIVGLIGADYDVAAEYDALIEMRTKIILIAMLSMAIASAIAIFISRKISKPIVKTTSLINKIAALDLSYDESYSELSKNSDETGVMAKSLTQMRDTLSNMVHIIKSSSDEIDNQAAGLSAVAGQMASATATISDAIQEVAVGAGAQANDLTNITEILNRFSQHIEDMGHSIEDISSGSKSIQCNASKGSIDMHELSNSVESVGKSFNEFTSKISILGDRLSQINKITEIINGIASQTSLLALNASIESARAGEAGSGFAVVAEEIRKLAEQSKNSAENINSLIAGVTLEASTMTKMTDTMSNELDDQVRVINTAMDSFSSIISGVDDAVPRIEAIGSLTSAILCEKNSIIEKIECASSVSQEVSASSEEIASSSEEMNASTEEVSSSAKVLAHMTRELSAQMVEFQL